MCLGVQKYSEIYEKKSRSRYIDEMKRSYLCQKSSEDQEKGKNEASKQLPKEKIIVNNKGNKNLMFEKFDPK